MLCLSIRCALLDRASFCWLLCLPCHHYYFVFSTLSTSVKTTSVLNKRLTNNLTAPSPEASPLSSPCHDSHSHMLVSNPTPSLFSLPPLSPSHPHTHTHTHTHSLSLSPPLPRVRPTFVTSRSVTLVSRLLLVTHTLHCKPLTLMLWQLGGGQSLGALASLGASDSAKWHDRGHGRKSNAQRLRGVLHITPKHWYY